MVERARHADPHDDGLWLLEAMRATADAQQPGLPLIGEADVSASHYGDFLCEGGASRTCSTSTSTITFPGTGAR